MTNCDV
jgi:DNA-binding transcriptional MerR regulator